MTEELVGAATLLGEYWEQDLLASGDWAEVNEFNGYMGEGQEYTREMCPVPDILRNSKFDKRFELNPVYVGYSEDMS
jgi:hypothetical protein